MSDEDLATGDAKPHARRWHWKDVFSITLDIIGAVVALLAIASSAQTRRGASAPSSPALTVNTKRSLPHPRPGYRAAIINMVSITTYGALTPIVLAVPPLCSSNDPTASSVLQCLSSEYNSRWQLGMFSFMILYVSRPLGCPRDARVCCCSP